MNYSEYSLTAIKTLNDRGYDLNLCHALLGITTELEEYFQATNEQTDDAVYHAEEELGDLAWFINLAANTIGIEINPNDIEEVGAIEACEASIKFADWVKSTAIYGKAVTPERKKEAEGYLMELLGMVKYESYDFEKCLQANITKLQYKRYKKEGKYSEIENFNRDKSDGVNAVREVFGENFWTLDLSKLMPN